MTHRPHALFAQRVRECSEFAARTGTCVRLRLFRPGSSERCVVSFEANRVMRRFGTSDDTHTTVATVEAMALNWAQEPY